MNELGDQAGQHEMIAENLSTSVVSELTNLVKQLKDDRRKVRAILVRDLVNCRCDETLSARIASKIRPGLPVLSTTLH